MPPKLYGFGGARNPALGVIGLGCEIRNMHDRLGGDEATYAGETWAPRCLFARPGKCTWRIDRGDQAKAIAFQAIHISELGIADADRLLQHRCKDGLQIAR
jgi:hypothetical protein